jgi:catechol 2,3-dioxygenase-like lactoylglutathione lyase family enzyme
MATTSELNLPIKRITHVTIAVSDMERSLAFYRKVLGWKQIDDTQVDLTALAAVVGPNATCRALVGRVANLGVELISGSFIPNVRRTSSLGVSVLAVEVPDAQAAFDRLVAGGITPLNQPGLVHGVKMFQVEDPDGQRIEFCEYVPGACPWDRPAQ